MTPYYVDESVTLYHGDAREITEWLVADVLVTDPPYGISLCARSRKGHGERTVITGEVLTRQSSDRVIPAEHVNVRDSALDMWGSGRPALVFGSWRAPRPAGTQMRLVWDKGIPGLGGVGPWRQSDEEIYALNWPNPKFAKRPWGTVIRHHPAYERDHPTEKPSGLMEYLIEKCPPGVVADPFAGSGSTLIAARNLYRKAVGVEIEERYCELIAKRLMQGFLEEAK
jgi:site-specific DNA-methyltransferase (adenine-specific)